MYISYNAGASWKKFQLNLPVVPITDMAIKNNDLIVATQGRAFWILDDLGIVQSDKSAILGSRLHVLPVNEAYRMSGGVDSNIRNGGMNPPNGVVFNYYLKDITDSSVITLSILDQQGKKVKTFSRNGKEKDGKLEVSNGMNRLVWDMQNEPGERIDGMILWSGGAGGPKSAPGSYKARFRYGSDSVEVPFVIKSDPNYKIPDEEYREQVNFLLQVRDKYNEVQRSIKNIRSMRAQINDLVGKMDTIVAKEFKPMSDSINKRLTAVEEAMYQTKVKAGQDILNYPMRLNDRLGGLYNVAASGNNAPTQQVKDAFKELSNECDVQLNKLKAITDTDVKSFNNLIIDKRIPVIGVRN